MSKASEWAQRVRAADATLDNVKRGKPASFTLCLNLRDRLYINIQDDGTPRVSMPDAPIGYDLEVEPLLDMAHWILDTFGATA